MSRSSPFELVRYLPPEGGVSPFQQWLDGLKDRAALVRIRMRLSRVAEGLFGDSKSVGEGVCELRIDCGPGYRMYYARWRAFRTRNPV